jgi:hypothetical protein
MTRHVGFLVVIAIAMVMTSTPAAAGPSVLVLHTYDQNQGVRRALDVGIQNAPAISGVGTANLSHHSAALQATVNPGNAATAAKTVPREKGAT